MKGDRHGAHSCLTISIMSTLLGYSIFTTFTVHFADAASTISVASASQHKTREESALWPRGRELMSTETGKGDGATSKTPLHRLADHLCALIYSICSLRIYPHSVVGRAVASSARSLRFSCWRLQAVLFFPAAEGARPRAAHSVSTSFPGAIHLW